MWSYVCIFVYTCSATHNLIFRFVYNKPLILWVISADALYLSYAWYVWVWEILFKFILIFYWKVHGYLLKYTFLLLHGLYFIKKEISFFDL
jgi:hypothetical protein